MFSEKVLNAIVVLVFEKDKPNGENGADNWALPPAVLEALGDLVPDVLLPSTFQQVQFRAGIFGAYEPAQVDAFLERAAEVTAFALRKLVLADGTRDPEPQTADIAGLPVFFREAVFRRQRNGYRREDVDVFLERAAVAAEELARTLGTAGTSSPDP